MKNILVIGGLRSATSLISYLLNNVKTNNWFVSVADYSLSLAEEAISQNTRGRAFVF